MKSLENFRQKESYTYDVLIYLKGDEIQICWNREVLSEKRIFELEEEIKKNLEPLYNIRATEYSWVYKFSMFFHRRSQLVEAIHKDLQEKGLISFWTVIDVNKD